MTDLVCPVRPGDDNPELRLALRTWETHLTYDQLWIVGHQPAWLTNANHIPGNHHNSGHRNVYDNIRLAAHHPDIADDIIIVNDDMFILETMPTIPTWYRSTLDEHLQLPRVQRAAGQWWPTSLETTKICLQAHGIETPLSYELHSPFAIDKQQMAATLDLFAHVTPDNPPQWRSLAGNQHHLGGTPHADGKAYGAGVLHYPVHSTEDASFGHYESQLEALFSRASRHEKVTGHA